MKWVNGSERLPEERDTKNPEENIVPIKVTRFDQSIYYSTDDATGIKWLLHPNGNGSKVEWLDESDNKDILNLSEKVHSLIHDLDFELHNLIDELKKHSSDTMSLDECSLKERLQIITQPTAGKAEVKDEDRIIQSFDGCLRAVKFRYEGTNMSEYEIYEMAANEYSNQYRLKKPTHPTSIKPLTEYEIEDACFRWINSKPSFRGELHAWKSAIIWVLSNQIKYKHAL